MWNQGFLFSSSTSFLYCILALADGSATVAPRYSKHDLFPCMGKTIPTGGNRGLVMQTKKEGLHSRAIPPKLIVRLSITQQQCCLQP